MKLISRQATGVCCKYLAVWLLTTAGLIIYGETAPSVADPDYHWAVLCMVGAVPLFYFGCRCDDRLRRGKIADAGKGDH